MCEGTAQESAVFVLDEGEASFGEIVIVRTLEDAGFAVHAFSLLSELAQRSAEVYSACVLANLHARGFDTLQLPRALAMLNCTAPVVCVADRIDVRGSVTAMKAGAMHVLPKPIDPTELLGVVRLALAQDRAARLTRALNSERLQRVALLTRREYEVCRGVSTGFLNKQIAARLGIAEKTVKIHRSQAMHKLRVGSVPELVRMMDGLPHGHADTQQACGPTAHA
jgi:FixJ family two-component response regulator